MDADDAKEFTKESWGVVAKSFFLKLILSAVVIGILAVIGLGLYWMLYGNFVDNYEIGYRYDTMGKDAGKIQMLPRTGWFFTTPFKTKIHTIDGRPMQVCISAINRVLNCKLVQFDPAGLDLFVSWHGRNNYKNEGNDTSSDPNTSTNLNELLKNYAYDGSGKSYPFLKVLRELKSDETQQPTGVPK